MKITVVELFLPHAKNEAHVREFLKQNPNKLEVGSIFVVDEFPLYGGHIDMVFRHEEDLKFVELKFSKYPSDKVVVKAKDQMIKYYEGIISFFKVIRFDVSKINMYLVIGVSDSKEDKRYEVEIKEGKYFSNLDAALKEIKEDKSSLLGNYTTLSKDIREEILTLEGTRNLLTQYKATLEDEINKLLKTKDALLNHYGDKLLYILPDFWSQEVDSHKCFVCGKRNDIVLQAKQGLYGLCTEHFKMLNGYTPYIKPSPFK